MALNALISGLGVLLKLLCGLAANKILSTQLGPAAFGTWGNVFSLATLYTTFSNGGISQGLIAQLSSPTQDDAARARWLAGGLLFVLGVPVLIAAWHAGFRQLGVVSGAKALGPLAALALGLLAALALQIQATVLAQGRSRLNAIVVALSGVTALLSYWLFVLPGSIPSAVRALVISFATTLAIWLVVAASTRTRWHAGITALRDGWPAARSLAPYVAIALAPAVVGTAAVIAVREVVSTQVSPEAAGLWQGMFRISDAVVAMAQAVVSFVLLPEVFRSDAPRQTLKKRLAGYALLVVLGFIVGVAILWRGADLVVKVLYSEQYAGISPLLWIELLGDAFKALAMPFVAFFIYQRNLRFSWALELTFSVCFVLATYILTGLAGLAGAAVAYACANLALLIVAFVLFFGAQDA
ncbi:oligosaccharide flippase family protein [Cupriavidus sp. SK-4]|uniref:oligosaccharide flippase family protein n=1 Tax=Cupriavidus sp. SK-4 TaxID=574750 RepID=UPI0013775AA0|nr:oligosaccharide flippase family protein [Cupriavidus sp. SK-4]